MKRKLLFPLIAALLLSPWPVAYAYDGAMANNAPMNIEPAESSAAPRINAYGNAIGGITPGDLFYIDSSQSNADTLYTLYITNTDELIHHYRYMTLNIGVYVQTDVDTWEKVIQNEGETPRDNYVTLHNGEVSFELPGCANYRITVDKGCFYCHSIGADKDAASPRFYMTVS